MSTQKYLIGVDVGATKIAAGLVLGNKILKIAKIPTQVKKSKKTVLNNIVAAILKVYRPEVCGIGLGIAGQINQKRGVVITSPNLPKNFKNINLKKIIQKKFKGPVIIENDANCFVLGEAIFGAGRNYQNVVGLTLGTGVGGGLVIDKKLYLGKNGWASEFGHLTIRAEGFKCSCGQKGHLEAYCAGPAMIKLYRQFSGKAANTFEIEKLYKKGDRAAKKVFELMAKNLAQGLASLINTLNPNLIVLGGGLSKVKFLIQPAIKLTKTLVFLPPLKSTKIIQSQLKEKAAILGAAYLFNF